MMNTTTTDTDRVETRTRGNKHATPTVATPRDAAVHSGMGAIVTPEGVAFRVWAPNAKAVFVTGEFDGWSERGLEMKREDNGTWYRLVPDADVGHEYRYLIRTADDAPPLSRVDPRALKVTNSVGNGIVWKPEKHPRKLATRTPQNEMVIYEMHVGSFNPTQDGAPGTFQSAIEKLDYLKDRSDCARGPSPPLDDSNGVVRVSASPVGAPRS